MWPTPDNAPCFRSWCGAARVSFYNLIPIFYERGFGGRGSGRMDDKAPLDSTGSVIEMKSYEFDFCCPDFESDRAR